MRTTMERAVTEKFLHGKIAPRWRRFLYGLALCVVFILSTNIGLVIHYFYGNNVALYEWKIEKDYEPYFRPMLSKVEETNMINILHEFVDTLDKFNISYIMYSGTLIGSYRHLGPIPWDDDLDMLVDLKDKERVRNALKTLEPDYKLYTGYQWKLYADGPSLPYRGWWERWTRWRWPFVDIFFYDQNNTHIWDTAEWNSDQVYQKTDTFPLVKRPYGRLWLNAPHDTKAILSIFHINDCISTSMNHKTERRYMTTKSVSCDELHHQYPFVQRTKLGNKTKESLQFADGSVIRTVFL